MKNFLRLAAILMFIVPLAASCGGGGSPGTASGSAPRGPDRNEGPIEDAKLQEFLPLFPAAPAGYTRGERPGIYSGSDQSTITYTYQNNTKMFTVVFTFSTKHTGESEAMINDESQRNAVGYELTTVAGRPALTPKARAGRVDVTVVLSNSRMVAIAQRGAEDVPDAALVQQVAESIDYNAIANKN
jgi:hypothetical protein